MERFELHGRKVAQGAVEALGVVKVPDPLSHGYRQLDLGSPLLAVEQLDLHRAPEALHRGVVVAVADRAHGADEVPRADQLAEAPRGELAAVVRVDDRAGTAPS